MDRSADAFVYFEAGDPELPAGFFGTVVWPFGFEAEEIGGNVVIRSGDGIVEIHEGQEIAVSGEWDGEDTFEICAFE